MTLTDRITALSVAIATKIKTKVDMVAGKALSTNDFTDTLKTKLEGLAEGNDSSAFKRIVEDLSYYKIDTSPYTTPGTVEEAKAQAKAQVEKKRIDYLASKQTMSMYTGDERRFRYLDAVMNVRSLTTDEKTLYNKLLYRMDFIIKVDEEANVYDVNIDAGTTVVDIVTISTDATFITEWGVELDE